MGIYETALSVYLVFLAPVAFFSMIFYILALSGIFYKPKALKLSNKSVKNWPFVSIHIPVYNDPVATRCIEHCLKFDYPKDKFEILVADDSKDNTKEILDKYTKKYKTKVRVIRRESRKGFKAGALNNLLKFTKGDFIVVLDSDFTPSRGFLKKIVRPMIDDEKVAYTQSRMGYVNTNQNFITKFATAAMMMHHQMVLPINNSVGTPLLCGSGDAIRKSVLLKMGRWNENSLTEDADLSMKIILSGYKCVYLPNVRANGEMPFTLMGFFRQQTRWTYGTIRVFVDYAKDIFFHKKLSLPQRVAITYNTLGSIAAPLIIGMTIAGFATLSLATPRPLTLTDFEGFAKIFGLTGGFIAISIVALAKEKKLYLFKSVIVSTLSLGILLSIVLTFALARAFLGIQMTFSRTPKSGNLKRTKTWYR